MEDYVVNLNSIKKDFEENITILEQMIETTDLYYGNISEQLPTIESEIDNTIEETKILISYFIDPEDSDEKNTNGEHLTREILTDLEKNIEKAFQVLRVKKDVYDKLGAFLSEEEGERAEFEQILELIENLQKELTALKNLSINAGIHSFKVGNKGAGFKVVAKEINELSQEAEDEYEVLEEKIVELENWYQKFRTDIQSLIEYEENVIQNFQEKISKNLWEVINSLKSVASLFEEILDQIKWGVEPVSDILIAVQNQDIIKQNMENLIEIMRTSSSEIERMINTEDQTQEDILNYYVFMINCYQLGSRLMSNILTQLDDSLFAIQEKFNIMEERLKDVINDNLFLSGFVAGIEENPIENTDSSLSYIFEESLDFINNFKSKLKEVKKQYNYLIENKEDFSLELNNIEEKIDNINDLASLLSKIRVFAKIELTRIDEEDKFIKDIQESINQFSETSKREKKVFYKLQEILEENYENFLLLADKNQHNLTTSRKAIDKSKEQLLLSKNLIADAIQALNQSLHNLSEGIFSLNNDLTACVELKDKGESVVEILEEKKNKLVDEKQELLVEIGIENWPKTSNRLQNLIEEFTSYVERKTASEEFSDLEIDVGDQEGELTLF